MTIIGTSFTAPSRGYIIGSGGLSSGSATLYIDSIPVGITPDSLVGSIYQLIDKGQVFSISDSLTTQNIKFYAEKGDV
jgi:hypothetical protein